jgi:hypothetical protein
MSQCFSLQPAFIKDVTELKREPGQNKQTNMQTSTNSEENGAIARKKRKKR